MAGITLTFPEAIKQAAAAYDRGQLGEAEQLARAILDVKADDFHALHLLAVIKARREQHDEALAIYDRALAVRSDHADALYNRSVTLQELKRLDEALASYDRALAVRPDYAEALNNRGSALRELKRLEEALASYDRALAVRPDYADALNNRRGVTLHQLDRAYRKNWLFLETIPLFTIVQKMHSVRKATKEPCCWRLRRSRREGWLSVDTIEDIAVLGALLVFSSLSLAVIVLMY